eukprot:TRINITY_DN13131_c0_g1_i2.p1 TRINITY_DN13131_c0_g1~~TRINITY_DN13131_c0_g1_i2.p1  ORF type:complete len:210 (-),score=46.88 TRINITY_DN13131_c0_g1_i2:80-709(-)
MLRSLVGSEMCIRDRCYSALKRFCEDNKIPLDIPVWFCVFSNYQAEDGEGPSIQKQLDLTPFSRVIESKAIQRKKGGYGMVAVHTSKEDLYLRLWCVHEVDEAQKQNGVLDDGVLDVRSAMSEAYVDEMKHKVQLFIDKGFHYESCLAGAGICVTTIKATCGYKEDYKMLLARIGDDFERLDLSLIHISEPTRLLSISYAVFCLKKKNT